MAKHKLSIYASMTYIIQWVMYFWKSRITCRPHSLLSTIENCIDTVEPHLSVPSIIRNGVQKFLKQVSPIIVEHVIHRLLFNKGSLSKKVGKRV